MSKFRFWTSNRQRKRPKPPFTQGSLEHCRSDVTIKKLVTGNMGDTSKAFNFTVTSDKPMGEDTAYQLSNGNMTATITNNKSVDVDTGITLDSIPFVLILAVCAGAAVLFLIKRRSVEF